MLTNLFIIGNGFDLAHGLKTSYNNFFSSLINNICLSPDSYLDIIRDDMVSYFSTHRNITRGQLIFKNKILQRLMESIQYENWSDIEFIYFDLIQQITKTPKSSSEKSQMIKNVNEDFEKVKCYLRDYLEQEQKKFIPIDAYYNFFTMFNSANATIINFNYTNTVVKYLEESKNINLINIHGEINNDQNPMIFGFAASDDQSKELIDQNDNEYMRNIKKVNYMLTNNDKKIKSLMNETRGFDIIILGHSCGISDRLILSQIFNHKNAKSITPFYFKDREGYLQTIINIDRIIDDYSKNEKEIKSFAKLENYPQCFHMLQHNSTNDEFEQFKKYIKAHRISNKSRYDLPNLSSLLQ